MFSTHKLSHLYLHPSITNIEQLVIMWFWVGVGGCSVEQKQQNVLSQLTRPILKSIYSRNMSENIFCFRSLASRKQRFSFDCRWILVEAIPPCWSIQPYENSRSAWRIWEECLRIQIKVLTGAWASHRSNQINLKYNIVVFRWLPMVWISRKQGGEAGYLTRKIPISKKLIWIENSILQVIHLGFKNNLRILRRIKFPLNNG